MASLLCKMDEGCPRLLPGNYSYKLASICRCVSPQETACRKIDDMPDLIMAAIEWTTHSKRIHSRGWMYDV